MDAATAFQAAARQGPTRPGSCTTRCTRTTPRSPAPTSRSTRARSGSTSPSSRRTGTIPKIKDEVDAGQKVGTAAGANGTPTFFINGRAAGRRAAGRRVREDHRRRDQEGGRAHQEGDAAQGRLHQADRDGGRWRPRRRRRPARPTTRAASSTSRSATRRSRGRRRRRSRWSAWSDFQCPFCSARRCRRCKQIEKEYEGKVRIAFKQLPAAVPRQGAAWRPRRRWPPTSRASSGRCTTSCSPTSRRSTARRSRSTRRSSASTWPSSRRRSTRGKFKDKVDAEDKEGAAVGVDRHADLLHQRHPARRRPAVRRPSRPSSTKSSSKG